MASDLGLKATVEFEAEGQQQVLAQVNALQAGMKAMEQAFAGPTTAVGLFSSRFEREARAAQIVAMGWAQSHQQAMNMIAAASERAALSSWESARQITTAAKQAGAASAGGGGLGSSLAAGGGAASMFGSPLVAGAVTAALFLKSWFDQRSREVSRMAEDYERGMVDASISVDRLKSRLQELSSEGERVRIGTDIRSQIAQLTSELGKVQIAESLDKLGPINSINSFFEDLLGGADLGEARIKQLREQIEALRDIEGRTESQPLANAGRAEAEAARKAAADAAKARAEAKAEFERQTELNYAQDDRRRWEGKMDAAGENPLKQMQVLTAQLGVEQQKLNALKAVGLDADKMSAETIAMQAEKTRQAQDEVDRITRALREKENEVWKGDDDPKTRRAGGNLDPRLNFDRFTRIGATLGDPGLAAPNRRDPTFFQERANQLLERLIEETRANRRANYVSPAAYED